MSDVLPFVTWLANARHRTIAHAFVPTRSLSVCKAARKVSDHWQPADATTERCKRCSDELERMRVRGAS